MSEKSVVLYYSNNHAVWTTKLLKKAGIRHRMIPVPRHLSSDCGYCVEISTVDTAAVEEILGKSGVEYSGIQSMAS